MRKAHQPHPTVRQQRGQRRQVQRPRPPVDPPFADLDPRLGQASPDARVRLVVLVGHHHRATKARQPRPHRLRQHVGAGAGGRAERHLLARHAQHRGQPRARLVHLGPAGLGPGIGRIGLHLAVGVEPRQPVDHLAAGVAAPGVFKERMARQHGRGKGRKLRPHER